uniref:HAT C-terminal dimerisation domain-containing protein n=1 Tax=Lactuca sativa TaxID=4236 RepID=A0A9R1XNH3_LACSA|nr:hypothetical protein LSAT_V11C200090060 [Lactuca sativa]
MVKACFGYIKTFGKSFYPGNLRCGHTSKKVFNQNNVSINGKRHEEEIRQVLGYMEPSLTPTGIDIKARQMVREVENRKENFFMTYLERFENSGSSQQEVSQIVIDVDDDNDFFGDFLCKGGSSSDPIDNEVNAIKFPTVARMAKDILAIQISSVASESAVSTCGRVVSEYHTSLSTLIVEGLLCTQDWVRKVYKSDN